MHSQGASPKRLKGLPVGMKVESSMSMRKSLVKPPSLTASKEGPIQSIVKTGDILKTLEEMRSAA